MAELVAKALLPGGFVVSRFNEEQIHHVLELFPNAHYFFLDPTLLEEA